MMSVTQSLIGLGSMIYPIFVQFLMDQYGFRATVAIIAACSAHAIWGMLVMHPVEWHCKKVRVPIDEVKPCKFLYAIHLNDIDFFLTTTTTTLEDV